MSFQSTYRYCSGLMVVYVYTGKVFPGHDDAETFIAFNSRDPEQ